MTEENTTTQTSTEETVEADGGRSSEEFSSFSESRGIHYNFDMEEE